MYFEQDGNTLSRTETNGVITYTVVFPVKSTAVHFSYKKVTLRGLIINDTVAGTVAKNTSWRITASTVSPQNVRANFYSCQSSVFTPAFDPTRWNQFGYATGFSFKDTSTVYTGKTIVCNPLNNIPPLFLVRNEVNMLARSPGDITDDTVCYCLGRGGGVGGPGSAYAPFDVTKATGDVTYDISMKKSQGQTVLMGYITYTII